MKTLLVATLSSMIAATALADVSSGKAGPMQIDIGYGIIVNQGSTLEREWMIVNDDRLPVSLNAVSPTTRLNDRNWVYDVSYELDVSEDIQAFEVRFIPFNIWGEKDRSLSATDISDRSPGKHTVSGSWRILSENDAIEHYAMLGYIAQVKLRSGAIRHADPDAIVRAAQSFSSEFTAGDLNLEGDE